MFLEGLLLQYSLPDDFFDVPDREKQQMLFANLQQLLQNYEAIEKEIYHGLFAFSNRKYRYMSIIRLTLKYWHNYQKLIHVCISTKGIYRCLEMNTCIQFKYIIINIFKEYM